MVSQFSILFLLAFSAVAVSAQPVDRRVPDSPGGTANQAAPADQIQASREKLNKALACVDDKMKMPKIPLATAGEPGQSPLPWVDALQECLEMHYSKSQDSAASGQVGPDGDAATGQPAPGTDAATGQVGPDGNASTGKAVVARVAKQ
jgi:hypothetical protein